jgi:hypothetical protein
MTRDIHDLLDIRVEEGKCERNEHVNLLLWDSRDDLHNESRVGELVRTGKELGEVERRFRVNKYLIGFAGIVGRGKVNGDAVALSDV